MREIPIEEIVTRIKIENPWWNDAGPAFSSITDFTPRPYLDLLFPLVSDRSIRRAVVLMGPRRVGKTVLLHHAIQLLIEQKIDPKKICYVSVDHPLYNGLSLENIVEAYRQATDVDYATDECFFFFDEIQYMRDWEIQLKSVVDTFRNSKFVVSGSSAAALRLKSNESGAGRFTDFLLPPLTFHEYLTLLGEDDLVRKEDDGKGGIPNFSAPVIDALNDAFINYLNFGGYPEVALSREIQADPGRFVKSDIIDKVLLRDLPSLYGVQDVQELNYLFTTLAYNTANEVTLDSLSQKSGASKATIKRYIEYLEAAFLIKVVHRVDRNAKRFKRANFFKVYLTNPSIRAALFSTVDADDEAMGALVETAIFAQFFHSDINLHYARWRNGEVDIVGLTDDQKVKWAVEAKWTNRYFERPKDLKSLIQFCHSQNLNFATVTTRTNGGFKTQDSVRLAFSPAALYCYALGYSIIRQKRLDA